MEKKKNIKKLKYEKPEMKSTLLNENKAIISDCSPGTEMASPWHPCKSMKT